MVAGQAARNHRAGAIVLLGLVLAAGVVVSAIRPPWLLDPVGLPATPPPTTRAPTPLASAATATPTATPQGGAALPAGLDLSWLRWLLLAAALALIAITAAAVARRLGGRREPAPEPAPGLAASVGAVDPDLNTLAQGAQHAQDQLAQASVQGQAGDAIVAAWLALERAAVSTGVERFPAQTPTEFTSAVLRQTGAPQQPVEDLLALYLQARFGVRESGPAEVSAAEAAIHQIAASWDVHAPKPDLRGAPDKQDRAAKTLPELG